MIPEPSSRQQRFASFLREKYVQSKQSINRQLPHWVYVILAISAFAVLAIGILQAGYTALPDRTPRPTPPLRTARHYPTPTPLPTWSEPVAYVSTSVLRIFDSFGASGNYVSQLQSGDRVQVLARSADGAWTQIQTWDGILGWTRTDRLVMARASHAPVPTVRAQVPPEVLFSDDFQDPESGLDSYADETGERHYRNGEYVIRVSSYNWTWWAFYPQSFMDCEIQVDARPVMGEEVAYGLVFRAWGDGSYFFLIRPDGWYSLRKATGDLWLTSGESDAIHPGRQTNRLGVRADGPQISLYVNDQLLGTATDATFDGGWIGLIVQHLDYQDQGQVVEVHFDNLEVRNLSQGVMPTATPQVTPTPVSQLEQTPVATATSAPRDTCFFKHRVMQGDDLAAIALRYKVSVTDIRSANGSASDAELLRAGNDLCIPSQPATWPDLPADPTPLPGRGCRFMHVVRAGDSWYRITMRYGVSKEDILKANDDWGSEWSPALEAVYCIP
jgi:LysM repeat protein